MMKPTKEMNDDELRFHIATVKQRRGSLDSQVQAMRSQPPSRETALAITKTQEAVMWLGMELKRVREEHPDSPAVAPPPYPGSKDSQIPGVEPTADNLKF